jgi:hypothetical protein
MDLVQVEIDSIRVSLMSQDRVVVLKDQRTERYLPRLFVWNCKGWKSPGH